MAFVWIGVALPPLSAVWFSPLAAIAYALPIVYLPAAGADQNQGLLTTVIVIPVCVLVGEVLSRVVERLWHTQVSEREYAAAYVMERAAVRNLRALEQRLRDAESRYRTLVEQIPAVTYIDAMDAASTTLYISPQVEQLLGYAPHEWQSDAGLWERLLHPEDRERVLAEHLRSNGSTEPYADEYRLLARNGRVVWIRDEASIVHDDEGHARFWQGVMLDVTDRKRAQEQVAFLAYHDKLTGLPNLAMFEEHLGVALARAERQDMGVAVLYVDFDKFKLVNDTLGHGAGDQLLRDMVDRLQEATRATDLVARLGGDEFLILLADLEGPPPAGHGLVLAELVASRIHESLQRPFQLGDTEFYISASIGISVYPLDARDAHSLVMHADQAMYRSKKTGAGGYVVFARDMASGVGALNLATQLRKAVAEKQWALHYQPIVDLVRGHIVGVEALLRWIHPDKGTVEPAMFVPLLEELGLIGVVSDWVLEELGRQCRSWREQDLELNVAFNLSPRGLWHPDLGTKLLDLTKAMGNDCGRDHDRDHRVGAGGRPGARPGHPARPPRAGPGHRARRLRHGVLLAVAAAVAADRGPEDRPVVHPRRGVRPGGAQRRPRADPAGAQPRDGAAGGGRGDAGAARVPRRARVHPRAGVLLQPAPAGRPDHDRPAGADGAAGQSGALGAARTTIPP